MKAVLRDLLVTRLPKRAHPLKADAPITALDFYNSAEIFRRKKGWPLGVGAREVVDERIGSSRI